MTLHGALVVLAALTATAPIAGRASRQAPLAPKPFPGAAAPAQPRTPESPTTTPAATAQPERPAPTPTAPATTALTRSTSTARPGAPDLGVQIYPTAEFLDSIDAGKGQRYYLYGTNASFLEIVGYYKTVLKNGGRELFNKTQPTQQFDLGKFQDDTMAYPPSVVVKDYTWNGSGGYLHVAGTTDKRFRTIIQIVPALPVPSR